LCYAITDVFDRTLDDGDSHLTARSSDESSYVVRVACEYHRFPAKSYCHHNGVNDIRSSALAEQPSCFVRLAFAKRDDRASRQETPELGLLW